MKVLESIGVPYHVIVEDQEYDLYAEQLGEHRLLVLDKQFQEDYEKCDDLGMTKSPGSGPARNFAWAHAIETGHAWHWTMDDNIQEFYRLSRNRKIRMADGTFFKAMEDFVLRYENIAMAGPNYEMFAKRRQKIPPFVPNTRIYSCNLIRCDVPFRWRGRWNEDTILSLDMLKAGWCTILFNAFLQNKMATQKLKGGNTELYQSAGTKVKSQMIIDTHPDVSEVVWKFNRWHHYVDYRPFRRNKLIRKPDAEIPQGVNNYGLSLKKIDR
jgi:hypothetical protein